MYPVWVANALSTGASRDTCPRPTVRVAFTNTTFHSLRVNPFMRWTYLRGSMDSNTFPLGGTEFRVLGFNHQIVYF